MHFIMKRLRLDALKFEATLDFKGKGGESKYLNLKLRYFVVDGKDEVTLVHITLKDTKPFNRKGGPLFWFHFTPIERSVQDNVLTIGIFPQIDLIVFSSIEVLISRRIRELDKYQLLGFEGTDPQSMLRDNLFSPVRPKISLRRVHDKTQIPPLGSSHDFATINADFSFYVDVDKNPQYTTTKTYFDLEKVEKISSEENRLIPKRTWTQVFFDAHYTEFTFVESSFSLRVYDQYYDEIDRKPVYNDDVAMGNEDAEKLTESMKKIHSAALLKSKPKYFDFNFLFDNYPKMVEGGVQLPYRTRLDIWKSDNVLLTGTIVRNLYFDRMDKRLKDAAGPRPATDTRVPSYKDFLPWIHLMEWESKSTIPFADLEKSLGGKAAYEFRKNAHRKFMEFQFSVIIGFTPILGEAYGLYELYTALNHGEDAFGNKLSDTEKIIVAVAAILPLVGSGVLRQGVNKLSKHVFPLLSSLQESMTRDLSRLRAFYGE